MWTSCVYFFFWFALIYSYTLWCCKYTDEIYIQRVKLANKTRVRATYTQKVCTSSVCVCSLQLLSFFCMLLSNSVGAKNPMAAAWHQKTFLIQSLTVHTFCTVLLYIVSIHTHHSITSQNIVFRMPPNASDSVLQNFSYFFRLRLTPDSSFVIFSNMKAQFV